MVGKGYVKYTCHPNTQVLVRSGFICHIRRKNSVTMKFVQIECNVNDLKIHDYYLLLINKTLDCCLALLTPRINIIIFQMTKGW